MDIKKIILAFDSFKGCLNATEVVRAAADGIRRVFPECRVLSMPMADGGEGMVEIFVRSTGGRLVRTSVHGPLMEERSVCYGLSADGTTACIETAACCGLPLVPPERRNPLYTTSYGVGEVIREALQKGCRKFLVGLGGSATNDAGGGMLQALGYRFLQDGKYIEEPFCGRLLSEIDRMDDSLVCPGLHEAQFTVACDVRNPFHGPEGAACVFAPQKGASADEVERLDEGMRNLCRVYREATGIDVSKASGAGAAGGMGGCFLAFFQSRLLPGTEVVLDIVGLEKELEKEKGKEQGKGLGKERREVQEEERERTDFILTGEGKSDRQTLMGKVPYGILKAGQRHGIPVILLSGSVEESDALTAAGFSGVFSIQPAPVGLEEAMRPDVAQRNLSRSTEQLCRLIRAVHAV